MNPSVEQQKRAMLEAAMKDTVLLELIEVCAANPAAITINEETGLFQATIRIHNAGLKTYEEKSVQFSLGILDQKITSTSDRLPQKAQEYNDMVAELNKAEAARAACIAYRKSVLPKKL